MRHRLMLYISRGVFAAPALRGYAACLSEQIRLPVPHGQNCRLELQAVGARQ